MKPYAPEAKAKLADTRFKHWRTGHFDPSKITDEGLRKNYQGKMNHLIQGGLTENKVSAVMHGHVSGHVKVMNSLGNPSEVKSHEALKHIKAYSQAAGLHSSVAKHLHEAHTDDAITAASGRKGKAEVKAAGTKLKEEKARAAKIKNVSTKAKKVKKSFKSVKHFDSFEDALKPHDPNFQTYEVEWND